MEFKIDKINMQIIKKINEKTKDGKVHTKESVKINMNNANDKRDEEKLKDALSKKESRKRKIIVQASKKRKLEVDAFRDKNKDRKSIGKFLDVKK